jgi:hypothetical protein
MGLFPAARQKSFCTSALFNASTIHLADCEVSHSVSRSKALDSCTHRVIGKKLFEGVKNSKPGFVLVSVSQHYPSSGATSMQDLAVHSREETLASSRRANHHTKQARRAAVMREAARAFGAGSPYPSTPFSESHYDGEKFFDDCEPWNLR